MNPFDIIDARLGKIEALLESMGQTYAAVIPADENQFGNFDWYLSVTGEAESTARQRIARGDVPGVSKLGKRLLFDKALVLKFIKSNQRKTDSELTAAAEELLSQKPSNQKKHVTVA